MKPEAQPVRLIVVGQVEFDYDGEVFFGVGAE
jgi:hypothetical protein